MSKIVIVGHPQSGYAAVESLLNACGMGSALPSRREGLVPAEVNDTLCRAHQTASLLQLGAEEEIHQIDAGPVWHGMALDLMLGNLDHQFWGWADPQSIFLLNYWRDLDPSITFVLVYDAPQTALTHVAPTDASALGADALAKATRAWYTYNAALLHFFHRNPSRCLLVHSQQVRESAGSYIQQIRARIDAPWSGHVDRLLEDAGEVDTLDQALRFGANSVRGDHGTVHPVPDVGRSASLPFNEEAMAMHYLADAVIEADPSLGQLYEELQAAANLPLGGDLRQTIGPVDAWRSAAMQAQRLQAAQVFAESRAAQLELAGAALEQLSLRARDQQHEIDRLLLEKVEFLDAIASLTAQTGHLSEQRKDAMDRNEVLELQVRNEASHVSELREELVRVASEQSRQINQLATERADAAQLVAERDRSIEQLEAICKRAETSAKAQQQSFDGLARQLEESRQTARSFEAKARSSRAESETALADATRAKADGAVLANENDLLLKQLHHVQEELQRHFLENQSLKVALEKANAAKSKSTVVKPAPSGAAKRVKEQLEYRLGQTMVLHSKSVVGWFKMPFAVAREARQVRREEARRGGADPLPLEQYRDASEAERVKRHLSYRLGSVLLAHRSSPVGWISLPAALFREAKSFNNARDH